MVSIVEATQEYWEFIRILRTCKENTEGFEQQVEITPEQQIGYMQKYANNYLICLFDNEPVGFVGSIDGDIRVATHPDQKGRGFGKIMIDAIMEKFPDSFAKVKIENEASLSLFKASGFIPKYVVLHKINKNGN